MPAWSRRHALHAAGGVLLTALAGCNGSNSASRSVPDRHRDPVEDIAVLKIRHTDARPVVVERTDEPTTTQTRTNPRRRGGMMDHITDPPDESIGSPTFPADVAGADRLASFFDETDFDGESIYLYQSAISACYTRHLQGIYREDDGVDARFCSELRPADVACGADEWVMSTFAIRLPFPGDTFSSVGGGGSSSCDRPYRDTIEPDTSLVVGSNAGESE